MDWQALLSRLGNPSRKKFPPPRSVQRPSLLKHRLLPVPVLLQPVPLQLR